jgi:hypothetical protein
MAFDHLYFIILDPIEYINKSNLYNPLNNRWAL